VYVLRFATSDRKLFFWMQEPKTDKDDELTARVNQILEHASPASLAVASTVHVPARPRGSAGAI
jgi:hypothetical protein